MIDRGYFGIGVFHSKNSDNVGTLWRSAAIMGASFIFTIGKRYKKQATDTMKAYRHIPLYNYLDMDDFVKHIPYDCPVVAIEISDKSIYIRNYIHPERCIYLLGAEDYGIPPEVLNKCRDVIQIPGEYCYNVSAAGSIVMYDRMTKQ
jgi:tRNA G18 (ribose-2'-O)-methylase SpoU